MSDETRLDLTHRAMEARPEDDAARMQFYQQIADSELIVLLRTEPADEDSLDPELLDMGEAGQFLLAFDEEERLAAFAKEHGQAELPYAALPGRVVAQMLAGQGVGLAVNLGVAPSSALVPAEAMGWLVAALGAETQNAEARITGVSAPVSPPESLLAALSEKLSRAGGLASHALLLNASYSDGHVSKLLAFIDPLPGAEAALAQAANEALVFSGADGLEMDVAFFAAGDPITRALETHGARFDLPLPQEPEPAKPKAPGMDPTKPPIIR
ncbi:MAG: hypothetical protein CR993_07530 [Rhodobacterales bacterium]|nr:MAG: hypothetical protein CR993_07530 [Rhodobacterales bacterium]